MCTRHVTSHPNPPNNPTFRGSLSIFMRLREVQQLASGHPASHCWSWKVRAGASFSPPPLPKRPSIVPQSPVATPENGLPLPCSPLRIWEALQLTPSTHSHSHAALQASLLCLGCTGCSPPSASQQPPAAAAANTFLLGPGSRPHSVLQHPGQLLRTRSVKRAPRSGLRDGPSCPPHVLLVDTLEAQERGRC